jgi:hypothetical protein
VDKVCSIDLMDSQEMLAGNLAAIGVGGIVAVVWSYIVSLTIAILV